MVAGQFNDIDNMEGKLWDAFIKKERPIDFVLKNENHYDQESLQKALNAYRFHNSDGICLYSGIKEMLEGNARMY